MILRITLSLFFVLSLLTLHGRMTQLERQLQEVYSTAQTALLAQAEVSHAMLHHTHLPVPPRPERQKWTRPRWGKR